MNAPRDIASCITEAAGHIDPFVRHLPNHKVDNSDDELPPQLSYHLSVQAPNPVFEPAIHGSPQPFFNSATPDLAMMFMPTMSSNLAVMPTRGNHSMTIHREFTGTFGPHSILLQHIFHNCDSAQVNSLFSTQEPGNILIVVWGMKYQNLTYVMETRIKVTIWALLPNGKFMLKIAPPCTLLSHRVKGPLLPNAQKFIVDHTGTLFTFYVCGLIPDLKAEILREVFILTNLDSYQILNASNFVTDFVFMIDRVSALPDDQGQKIVEKLIKDKLYQSATVWSFLQTHHDTIPLSFPIAEIPLLVILSLEARGIWIEG
ncbi:hypothetical protein ARMGADRAFT_1084067 [Armillaria gallica]|uniref:Uncharacterized protein n=1 Tax=Armillaria gallica TaxID=47427 RepID=A0A2H3D4D0_ARMGA|nr:hypothetical protein ARMGADRAFT_1084067 [Armillaria gallica]